MKIAGLMPRKNPFIKHTCALSLCVIFLLGFGKIYADEARIATMLKDVEVQKSEGGQWEKANRKMKLEEGWKVRTGRGSYARVQMTDGSKMFLSPKTEVLIEGLKDKYRSFKLMLGKLKAKIKSLKRGKFDVKTPVAVASIRGTEFDLSYDGKTSSLDVFEGLVAVQKGGEEVMVGAGQSLRIYPDMPLGNPRGGGQQGKGDRREIRREVGLDMSKDQVMAAAAEEMRLAEYQEGKTLIDVNGNRVRLEEYIIREPKEIALADRDKAFKLVVLNERDDRFDYFYYRGLFNKTLPDDLSVALKDIKGKIGTEAPEYYLTEYETAHSNTSDYIKDNASGGHLVKIEYDGTNYILTDNEDTTNTTTITADDIITIGETEYHKIYDPVADKYTTVENTADYDSDNYRVSMYDTINEDFTYINSGDTIWRTRFNDYTHIINGATKQTYTQKTANNILAIDTDADWTFAGGYMLSYTDTPSGEDLYHNRVRIYYGDGTSETYDTYIIDDEGNIASTSDFAGVTTGAEYKEKLLEFNYEQIVTASEFQGRKIDLVVEPKILIKSGLID